MTGIHRRALIATAGLAGLVTGARAQGSASDWPRRPVIVVVPQAAGNSPDVLCRMVTERLSRSLGQQFVVENRPGAANLVGTQAVTRAAPDGYTLLFATSALLTMNPFTFRSLPYDPLRDLSPITMVARSNHVFAVNPGIKARTLPELIALEKAAPGTMSLAVDGPRNLSGLMAQAFNKYAGTSFVLVSYNTIASAIQDTVAGRVQATLQSTSVAEPFVRDGALRALAVAGERRIAAFPDVPPLAETVPALDLQGWFMMMGPAKFPADIAAKLGAEITKALADPELRKAAATLGFEVDPSDPTTPAASAEFLRKEYASAGRIIKDLGVEPQ